MEKRSVYLKIPGLACALFRYRFTNEICSTDDGNSEIGSQFGDEIFSSPDNSVAVASMVPVPEIVQSGAPGTLPRGTM